MTKHFFGEQHSVKNQILKKDRSRVWERGMDVFAAKKLWMLI
ncbi:MAG: hypothetical protein WBZ20_19620 [Nitrososphaeraceae archaeon]